MLFLRFVQKIMNFRNETNTKNWHILAIIFCVPVFAIPIDHHALNGLYNILLQDNGYNELLGLKLNMVTSGKDSTTPEVKIVYPFVVYFFYMLARPSTCL